VPKPPAAPRVPQLILSAAAAHAVVADVLVIAVAQGADGPVVLGELNPALRSLAESSAALLAVTGAADSVVRLSSQGRSAAPLLVLTGVGAVPATHTLSGEGSDRDRALEAWRRAAGAAVRSLADLPTADHSTGVSDRSTRVKVALALPAPDGDHVAAVAEGAVLGGYTFTAYRSAASAGRKGVGSVVVLTAGARRADIKAAAQRAETVASAVAAVRDLVNTPPCDLYPSVFAQTARAAVADLPVTVRVLDETRLAKGGYGGLTGVGQGSMHPPRLVRLDYHPAGARHHLALVGKGITFDSGGLSIKPAAGMDAMKSDMAGAAAVLHTVVAAARLGLPVRLTGWLALAENLPSGTAMRPSDVITIRGGRTVEVLDTDAEGRLVLADALVAAGELKPDLIVDVATLTGAQPVALGRRVSGLMANDDALRERVHRLSETVGEQFWPMPLPPELRASLDSPVADLANKGDRFGGMLVAGLFLAEFVGTRPWAHLDIAGPGFNLGAAHGYTGKGGTGVAVRTMLALAEDVAAHGV
jgi:leucyl aminopeptidase